MTIGFGSGNGRLIEKRVRNFQSFSAFGLSSHHNPKITSLIIRLRGLKQNLETSRLCLCTNTNTNTKNLLAPPEEDNKEMKAETWLTLDGTTLESATLSYQSSNPF